MGIGQETSPSDILAPADNNKEHSDNNIVDNNQNVKENEIELELAGKPWQAVASSSHVIQIFMMLLSYCLILLKCCR